MKILALEPYYGGSHKAFLDGWISRSRHDWSLLTLPPNKWKWRMRHSAITFAEQTRAVLKQGGRFDLIFCSDMLNLAEYRGLCPDISEVPALLYFHENQLTYPVEHAREWDYHFALTNMTSSLAAKEVWFNSQYNLDSFLNELDLFLKRMPDNQHLDSTKIIRSKSRIFHPCIEPVPDQSINHAQGEPLPHLLWAARWEHDKNPEDFFAAIELLKKRNIDFKLSVIGGGNSRQTMPVFEKARETLCDHIIHWGYLETYDDYVSALREADIAVSTANHEFFGISVAESAAAGAFPLVPDRLAYPELLRKTENPDFYYDGSVKDLADRLTELCRKTSEGRLWNNDPERGIRLVSDYYWENNVEKMDASAEALAK